jgi:hypothetical protein
MRNCTECRKDLSELKSAHRKCWHCRTGSKPKRGTYYKYPREQVAKAVAESYSYANVMRLLGIKLAGGSQTHITKKIKEYGLDTSHFTGQGHNKGKSDPKRKTWQQLLVLGQEGDRRNSAIRMKRVMLEYGFEYKCAECSIADTWNGKPIVLHIDHISGIIWDNRPENIRFLCPNCHSQTETYCRSKRD